MIRFIRALIYGAFAAVAATLILDWLDRRMPSQKPAPRKAKIRPSGETIDRMGEDAKKALLDELAAQV